MKKTNKAFTLIELLVVIAIISILAAILFPVFARARENARRSSCQSNLKQLGLGVMQYTQDYDEKFPPYSGASGSTAEANGWAILVQPYIKSKQILQCPSAKYDNTSFSGALSNYAINLGLVFGSSVSDWGKSLAVLTQPTLTVLAADDVSVGGSSTLWTSGCGGGSCTTQARAFLRAGAERHLDGANFVFTDGHVKWSKVVPATLTVTNMYNSATPGSVSGTSPTFNLTP